MMCNSKSSELTCNIKYAKSCGYDRENQILPCFDSENQVLPCFDRENQIRPCFVRVNQILPCFCVYYLSPLCIYNVHNYHNGK